MSDPTVYGSHLLLLRSRFRRIEIFLVSEGIRDGKRKPFNLPGGKPEGRETSLEALLRELSEELELPEQHPLLVQLAKGEYTDHTPAIPKLLHGKARYHSSILTNSENDLCQTYFDSNVPQTILRYTAENDVAKVGKLPVFERVSSLNCGMVESFGVAPFLFSSVNKRTVIRSGYGPSYTQDVEIGHDSVVRELETYSTKWQFLSDVYPMWWGQRADHVTSSSPPDAVLKWFSIRDIVTGVIAGKVHPSTLRQIMDYGLLTLGLIDDFQFRILMSMGTYTETLLHLLHYDSGPLAAHELIDVLGIAVARYDSRIQVRTLAYDRK